MANPRAEARVLESLERETGFEPATSTLARSHSTTELLPLDCLILDKALCSVKPSKALACGFSAIYCFAPDHCGSSSGPTTWPSRKCRMRFPKRAASGLWVIISTVWPSSRLDRCSISNTALEFWVSRFPVGSSASTIAGLLIRARAKATRCCLPPLNSLGRWSRRLSMPSRGVIFRKYSGSWLASVAGNIAGNLNIVAGGQCG